MVDMCKKLTSSCMDSPDISINCHDLRPDSDRALSISSNNTRQVHSVDSVFEFFSQDPNLLLFMPVRLNNLLRHMVS